jgi:regulator of sigma E protease
MVWNATIVEGLVGWAQGKVKMQLGGTVEVVAQTTEAAHLGAAAFFMTLAGISVFLALLNLLPVPALDGGRLFFLLIEMIRRRPVNQRIETAVHAMGFMALLTLMAFLTVNDVQRNLHLGGGDDGGTPSSGP